MQDLRKRWQDPPEVDPGHVESLQEQTGVSELICQLLAQRGITDKEEARAFLKPRLDHLHDPFEMKGMDQLVKRLIEAREKNQKIGIHGDYDVDGLTSTTLLTTVLQRLGFEVDPFVPHRMIDGYGVSDRAITAWGEEGVEVVLTCDTGFSAHEQVQRATEEWGMDVLITDHHTPPETLPEAHTLVNPKQDGCSYPFKDLCAAGITFKVLEALITRMGEDRETHLFPYLDLVALGTVCDVVPLVGENRVLAYWGLKVAPRSQNTGLRSLFSAVELQPEDIDEWKMGWVIGPRLNAVGRISDAQKGLELLTSQEPEHAQKLATEIDELNRQRKDLTDEIEQSATQQVEAMDLEDIYGIALFGRSDENERAWHHGVLGIVASRLVERFGRPAFLFARDEETGQWKGSGRAPSEVDVDLYEALNACSEHLEQFGGHAAAAGATLEGTTSQQRQAFREQFNQALAEQMEPEDRIPVLVSDLEVELDELTNQFYDLLLRFAPFGLGNPDVKMIARGVKVVRARRIGSCQTHIKLEVEQNGARFEAVGWGLDEEIPASVEEPTPYRADLFFKMQENTYRGRTTKQLVIKDMRITQTADEMTLDAIGGEEPDNLFA